MGCWKTKKPPNLLAIHWRLLSQSKGKQEHYLICPLDVFKHRKTKSNLLKDCIHHCLPITETKLISQEDTSGTTTQQHGSTSSLFCHNNRHYGYTEKSLKLFRHSVAKHFPPFLISRHSTVTSTFPRALTWTVGYHIRSPFSPNLLQDSPGLNFYTHSSMLRESDQHERGKCVFQGDSNESRNTGARWLPHHWKQCQLCGIATKPGTSSPEKAPDQQREGCPRGHQDTVFHNGFGVWDKNQHFWGQLRAMGIMRVLEADSGKQLSLQCRLRRSWGLAKFRMTGTPKEKR